MSNSDDTRDEVLPTGKWQFDDEVTRVFENMLERSIPDYQNKRKLVTQLILNFARPGTTILDLGISTGGAIEDSLQSTANDITYLGIEISDSMLKKANRKFQGLIENKRIELRKLDLRTDFPAGKFSVIVSNLTIQFVPIEHRQRILQNIYANLIDGGAFIFVEKVLGNDANSNTLLEKLYYEMKGENGYTAEQINAKRRALEGVLVPVTAKWNEDLMKHAGFDIIQTFWQQLNFIGWVAIKK